MTNKVIGVVMANDGKVATVNFPNGDERYFYRDGESEEDFRKTFSANKTVVLDAIQAHVKNRDDLFNFFKAILGEPTSYSVAHLGNDEKVLIAQGLVFGKTTVICSKDSTHADGGKGFAVSVSNRPLIWFHFSVQDLEAASELLLNAEKTTVETGADPKCSEETGSEGSRQDTEAQQR
jgi:hypothetical protein